MEPNLRSDFPREVRWNQTVSDAFKKHPLFILRQTSKRPRVTRHHRQPGVELHFTHSGRGTFHLGQGALVHHGKHVIVLSGQEPHQVYADPSCSYTRTVVCLDAPLLRQIEALHIGCRWDRLLPRKGFHQVYPTADAWYEIERILTHLNWEYSHRRENWQVSTFGALLQLLTILHRSPTSDKASSIEDMAQSGPITQCINFIERHLDDDLDVETLSQVVNLSPKHLSRLFSRTVGYGISHYIRHKRIELAREMLKNQPHLTISGIAYRCGFKTTAHFSRVFSEEVGIPPSEYRQSHASRN